MPWKEDGTFERTNNQFSGDEVWQEDQRAGIKVIDSRHDFHDEDLAQGISQCLNIDGKNAMRAPLDMGGFDLINVGTGEEDVADGIWTPTLPTGFTTGGNHGGIYVRLGRLCILMGQCQWIANTAAPLDPFVIGGLPYSIANPASGTNRIYLGNSMGIQGMNLSDNTTFIFTKGVIVIDSTTIQPGQYFGTNDPPNTPPEPNDEFAGTVNGQAESTGDFAFNFMYLTNDPMPT